MIRPLHAPALFSLALLGCAEIGGDAATDDEVAMQAGVTVVSLLPASDRWISSVEGVGDPTRLHRNVDDGADFDAADDNTTYVRATAGAAWARHTVGFAGAPPGRVTRADVHLRAASGGAEATLRVHLLDGATVVGSTPARRLGAYTDYTETFTDLDVASANDLRVRVEFNNTGGARSPRYTALWVDVTQGDAGAAPVVAGTWVLHQVGSVAALDSAWPAISSVMTRFPVTGFSLRIEWQDLEPSAGVYATDILDRARELMDRDHPDRRLSVRFMAGRYTPSFRRGNAAVYDGSASGGNGKGAIVPLTHTATGGRNATFIAGWKAAVDAVAAWCEDNDVDLLHLPWPGLLWAELALTDWHVRQPGYSYAVARDVHLELLDHALARSRPDFLVEFPTSGHVDVPQLRGDIKQRIIASPARDNVFVMTNNVDDALVGLPLGASDVRYGAQMVGLSNGYDWARVYRILLGGASDPAEYAAFLEVYTPSFTGGTSAELLRQVTAHAP